MRYLIALGIFVLLYITPAKAQNLLPKGNFESDTFYYGNTRYLDRCCLNTQWYYTFYHLYDETSPTYEFKKVPIVVDIFRFFFNMALIDSTSLPRQENIGCLFSMNESVERGSLPVRVLQKTVLGLDNGVALKKDYSNSKIADSNLASIF